MRIKKFFGNSLSASLATLVFLSLTSALHAQDLKRLERERERGLTMLKGTRQLIEEHYYDPTYHGFDLRARFKAAEERMKVAESLGHIFGIIAQAVVELNDSHTFFIPPSRPVDIEYGWNIEMIGDQCYVVAVKAGSDAETKGLKPGDAVVSLDGFRPTRQTLWKMKYNYNLLRPQPGVRMVVKTPQGETRELELKAEIVKRERALNSTEIYNEIREDEEDEKNRPIFHEVNSDIIIWKLRAFNLTESKVDEMMKTVKTHKTLILDLRGNGGGYIKTLNRLVSFFFDKEVVIAEIKQRKKTQSEKSKPRPSKVFNGELIVLVDSESGSAAEMFARVVQLEKRGRVIGDRTAGAVMQSIFHPAILTDQSTENVVVFGVSVTDADIIPSDGKRLENVGVTPDEIALPSADDMAAIRDPVLSRAVTISGADLSAEKAGTLFPVVWKRLAK